MSNKRFSILLLLLSAVLYYLLAYQSIRDDFYPLMALYGSLFVIYFYLISFGRNVCSSHVYTYVGIALRAILLFSIPALSDDFYRFAWDGRVLAMGDNPFLYLPVDYPAKELIDPDGGLFSLLNSQAYYTIYPPLLQFVFWVSALVSPQGLWGTVVTMKAFLLLSEAGTLLVLPKVLKSFGLDKRLVAFYALFPLAIVEFMGNIHFEAFMIFFLVVALHFLAKSRWQWAAVAFGFSVGAKILPLMFLPFLIKRIGWVRSIVFGLIVVVINVLLFLPFWTPDLLPKFFESVQLYFIKFEFNGSIYMLLRWIGYQCFDLNLIHILGRCIPVLIFLSILIVAFLEKRVSTASWPKMMLIAFSIYFALATTVNPWYIVVFVMLAALSGYRWPLLWAALIPLSYHTYRFGLIDEKAWVVALEYLPVYAFALYEFGWLNGLKRKWALKRAGIKVDRLIGLYGKEENVLEIGAGNGALIKLLREEALKVETVDVEDKSIFPEVNPVMYDGNKLPFADKRFTTVQMITMLHHTAEPERILHEAKRVGDTLIVMEDVYSTAFQKYITWFTDSLVNWEFAAHPHTNKTDKEWRDIFAKLGLDVVEAKYHIGFLLFFQQITYKLEVPNS